MGIRNRFRGTLPVGQWLLGGGGGVQSIQFGTVAISGTSNTATIAAVDTTRSVVLHLGSSYDVSATDFSMTQARVALTDPTTVTATKGATGDGGTATVGFVVIQFLPGVMRLVQRGTIALGGAASNTATITAVNTLKAFVNCVGQTFPANDQNDQARVVLTNATTVTATAGTASNNTVGFEVWEFV